MMSKVKGEEMTTTEARYRVLHRVLAWGLSLCWFQSTAGRVWSTASLVLSAPVHTSGRQGDPWTIGCRNTVVL